MHYSSVFVNSILKACESGVPLMNEVCMDNSKNIVIIYMIIKSFCTRVNNVTVTHIFTIFINYEMWIKFFKTSFEALRQHPLMI